MSDDAKLDNAGFLRDLTDYMASTPDGDAVAPTLRIIARRLERDASIAAAISPPVTYAIQAHRERLRRSIEFAKPYAKSSPGMAAIVAGNEADLAAIEALLAAIDGRAEPEGSQ